ncbi:DNA internalization-related competence protein ComEC/Rec2 [Caldichromatium japonicum]|uniref:DNA internalization-related competence protein ComEC/Rec2 n=1 Tax=Caldichromatium japonicum TaxID=2699430 RepID=A0A6G7VDD2_9GAMM|nr:DNA internalization-related competence protein ComEC/Rec2 [Caldichromatium japonicum]QIK38059.1 DNA internalization-related competence protein ComEC/Rec2 [Caldichromatium japonicum]
MHQAFGFTFALGVWGFEQWVHLPPPWMALVLLAAVLLGILHPGLRWLLILALGFGWAWFYTAQQLRADLPDSLARQSLWVEGRIASLPVPVGEGERFIFAVERTQGIPGGELGFKGRVRLSCYRDCPQLLVGERWRIRVSLKPRHGSLNPGGFDYERWLFEQGIVATGYVSGKPAWQRLGDGAGRYWLHRLRQRLAERLAKTIPDRPELGLIQALTLGERSGLDPELWEVFARTGTSHLIAISGLHVGLIAGLVFWLARRLWSLNMHLTLWLSAPRAAALIAFVAALIYAALAGFAIPIQRALIMLAVVLGAVFWQRALRPMQALALALVGVLLWDPLSILSIGFWLSFGAVGVLLFALAYRLPGEPVWLRLTRAQWAVALGLMPLLVGFFDRVSLIAPLVNLIAVPLFGLLILPAVLITTLLGLLGLIWPLHWVAEGLGWCLKALEWFATLPWAMMEFPERPLWAWVAAWGGVGLLLGPPGLPGRWLGVVLLLPLAVLEPKRPAWGEVWLSLLDVGQGLAVVVETAEGILVYDTGPAQAGGFDAGGTIVAPFLRARGIGRIDRLVISHADQDHAGGGRGLLARLPAQVILSGEPERLGLAGARPCLAGEVWHWSGVEFRFLHPKHPGFGGNNASCVLAIRTADQAILIPGDVDRQVEGELAPQLGPLKVLIAGHHGSKHSTSERLLAATRPEWVLFSSGYANRFEFPAREVRARLAARGISNLNTATAGTIRFKLGPQGWIEPPAGYRQQAARIWTHRPAE